MLSSWHMDRTEWWVVIGPWADGDARPAKSEEDAITKADVFALHNPNTLVRVFQLRYECRVPA